MKRHHELRFFAVASLVTLVGCGKLAEKLGGKAGRDASSTVDPQSAPASPAAKDPTPAVQLPADWPSNVPLYPGAKLLAAVAMQNGKAITMQTTDSSDQVVAFYRTKLPGKQVGAMDTAQMKSVTHMDGGATYLAAAQDLGAARNVTVSVTKL